MQLKKKYGKSPSKSGGNSGSSHLESLKSTVVWKVIKVRGITMYLKHPETGEVVMDYIP